jgi:hypothetical protein
MQNISSSFYTDGLRKKFDLFPRKLQNYLLRQFKLFPILKKFQKEHPVRHLLPKNFKTDFFPNPEFQYFKILSLKCTNPAQMITASRNLKSV